MCSHHWNILVDGYMYVVLFFEICSSGNSKTVNLMTDSTNVCLHFMTGNNEKLTL